MDKYWLNEKQIEILTQAGENPIEYKTVTEVLSQYSITEEELGTNIDVGNISTVNKGVTRYIFLDMETVNFLSNYKLKGKAVIGGDGEFMDLDNV